MCAAILEIMSARLRYNPPITMTGQQETLLRQYAKAVVDAPGHLHLTSEKDHERFWERHVMDAVHLVESIPPPYIRKGTKAIDIGSGNGVPGIILSILRPDIDVTLLDSDNKKCGFLDMFCNLVVLKNVTIIRERAEVYANGDARGTFDVAIARAVGKTSVALELGAGFLKRGGLMIVPHGTTWKEAYVSAERPSNFLGLKPIETNPYKLANQEFSLLFFKKVADTPAGYPRSVGVPAKKPLK